MRGLVAGVLTLWVAIPGRAEPTAPSRERVAFARFHVSGASRVSRMKMRSSLVTGLTAGGFTVVPDPEVERILHEEPGLAGCETHACAARFAELIDVHQLVTVALTVVGTSTYGYSLELIDAQSGGVLAAIHDSCQVCTTSEANAALSKAAAALRPKAPARKRDEAPPVPVTPSATALKSPPPLPPKVPAHIRALAIASGILGGLVLGGGVALILVDGQVIAKGSNYQDRIRTLAGGIAATSVGVTLAATSGVLFGYDFQRRQHVLVSPVVGPQGAGVRFSFEL
jgi:hypothetical protein